MKFSKFSQNVVEKAKFLKHIEITCGNRIGRTNANLIHVFAKNFEVLHRVHFAEDISLYRDYVIIGEDNRFEYYRHGVLYTRDQFEFTVKFGKSHQETTPIAFKFDFFLTRSTLERLQQFLPDLKEETEEEIRQGIDKALDERDEHLFMELTNKLKEVVKNG